MTEDYRERIIKWLSGQYDIEQSSTTPLFQELEQTTTTINTYLDTIQGYLQGKDGKGNDLNIGFIYGEKNNKGIIVIVDNNFNVLEALDEYNTGTKFNEFICLNIDKTNGNFYGIDFQDNKYRFILLNNFLVKRPLEQYEVKLRNDYFLNFTDTTFTPEFIDKKQTEALYIIVGTYKEQMQLGEYDRPAIATYQINVGSTNELKEYLYSSDLERIFNLKSYNIVWNDTTYTIKMNGYTWFQINPGYSAEIYYQEFNFDMEDITLTKDIMLNFTKTSQEEFDNSSSFEINNEASYITIFATELGYSEIGLYKINTTDYTEYRKISQTTAINTKIGGGKLFKKNNQIFYLMYLNTNETASTSDMEFTVEFGTIKNINNTILKNTLTQLKLYDLFGYTNLLNITNTYNLYTYNVIGSNSTKLLNIQQIYNSLNYNFEDYEDISSMIPNSAWLYSNNKIVFARNLYNKVLNGNTTVSTIEIPNMLLNDISITPQALLGETNGQLINETETITKNVYEDLFINFYNTITMQNQNTAIYISNLNGASRLNNSITQNIDYDNCKITKIRINYSDETNEIRNIQTITKISKFVYQFNFQIFVPKIITSIEFISNDEVTTYQTITPTLELNKYYSIKQNVEIEEG